MIPNRNLMHGTLGLDIVAAGARKEKARRRPYRHGMSTGARPYVELHAASAFSFLDGASLPEDLVDQATSVGLDSMALIDTNGVYGAPRFYTAAKKAGLRPFVGAELVLDDSWRHYAIQHSTFNIQNSPRLALVPDDEPPPATASAPRLTLLVSSRRGYRNLCRLVTAGALGREKGKARYDWRTIAEHAEDLVVLTGSDEGPAAALLRESGIDKTDDYFQFLQSIFPGRVYVELQRHHRRDEEHRNQALVDLAGRLRLPLLATNGVRYARNEEKPLLDILTCIKNGRNLDSAGRLLHPNRERYIKTAAQMSRLFADLPEAIDTSVELASKLDFTLADLGYEFPDYPLPPGETPMSFLRQIAWNGARARFRPLTAKAQAQIEKELNMIEKLDLAGYFLIVWDIVQFCQRERILVQGRGSAANSAVCYALSITAVDPVKMELLFERFLSEERGEWPDIDLDLPSGDQREKVIQYVYKRYGVHGAAMTANVITYRERSAAREVGKALGLSLEQVDRFAKQIGQWTFGEIRERLSDLPSELQLANLDPEEPRVQNLVRYWLRIQNLPRHLGQHSGGMVMARGRLDEVVPLEPASMPGRVVIQWDKDDCADLGLIKVDLLGLGMLQAIEEAIPLIRDKEKVDVDLAHLPADDPKVYRMLNEADTVGVFQVESRAQMATLPRNQPKTFYDLVIQVAIVRPGPIQGGMINPFFDRKHGKIPVEYPHPSLEPILKRTLGVPLFQEQLLRIAMVAANFTGGEAEELRRAMGFKRSMERMAVIEQRLRDGMTKNGIGTEAQEQIIRSITSFALYGFPESHAASFALIAYASAYIRAHHTAAFYVALLNAWPMGFYHPATLVKDAQRHGAPVLPVDVAHSNWKCTWEEGAIRMGLRYVKGLQQATGLRIEQERAIAPFTSLDDLTTRCRLRKNELTRLAWAGALASFGMTRRAALWQASRSAREAGPLFVEKGVQSLESGVRSPELENGVIPSDLPTAPGAGEGARTPLGDSPLSTQHSALSTPWSEGARTPLSNSKLQTPDSKLVTSPLPELSPLDETVADYQTMHLTVGPHFVTHMRPQLDAQKILTAAELARARDGDYVRTAGAVIVRQRPGTAKGFVFLTLEDETGMSQAIVRPDLFRENRAVIVGSTAIVVEGRLQNRSGQPSIRAERFWPLQAFAEVPSHDFH
jgi:error-prone DNA polymerase